MLQNKHKGFMVFGRELPSDLPVGERIKNYEEFTGTLTPQQGQRQALRCMNCGVPFCHNGCPLGNLIPDFNEAVQEGRWQEALALLHSTNNFPEFTGRVCPAPCEAACVLAINEPAVTIEALEKAIAERGWQEGWMRPEAPTARTGKRVAVIGSGPAGLAAAQQLSRVGHDVVVFERSDEPGGLLMYGIPDFKLSKRVVRRRIEQMRAEGVEFRCNAWIGKSVPTSDLDAFDAILLTIGSTRARELDIPGSKLDGIHLAMDFLPQQNRRCAGKPVQAKAITAKGKNVVVLGGGDTGSDCVGTCIRQGAKRIWSLELLPRPPFERDDTMLWPLWPMILRASSSHQEGGERQWSVLTKEFVGEHGRVRKLKAVKLEWSEPDAAGRRTMKEIPASAFEIECDLVLLALGFLHPEHDTIVSDLGLELDARGNIKTNDDFQTSRPNVFSAGDARRGQSLVVWAIQEGREAARCIDVALMGCSELPAANAYHWPDACGSHVRASSLG